MSGRLSAMAYPSRCRSRQSPFSRLSGRRRQQLLPRIRRVAALQHFSKDGVGVVCAFIGAQGRVIVHPGKHDDLGALCLLIAKEQAELLQEFRPEPMLVFLAERAALSVIVPRRVARDIFERNLEDRSEQLCRSLLLIAFWVFLAGVLYRADYRLKLVEEQRVRIDGPAVDLERIVAHPSSPGSDASTSTSTPLTRALARDTSDLGTGRIRAGS